MPVQIIANEAKRNPVATQAQRVDVTLMGPGEYEVSAESKFEIVVNLEKQDNRWVVVNKDTVGAVEHRVVFRMWTYDEMVDLRKQATSYDPIRRVHMVDQDALNRLKVQKLIVSWTFGEKNPRLELKHVGGVLTDESWTAFSKLQPNIIAYILSEMNAIYEYNG